MNPFTYARASDLGGAIRELQADPGAKIIAGGTNLVDLLKEKITRPTRLVDITRLPLKSIEALGQGGLRIGALVSNSQVAYDQRVEQRFPLLSQAILAGASPQLRNMATTGGNLLQRTRCYYFYDLATPCNKREPGSGCPAIQGYNRIHAILGASEHCIATHPSDMCVALAALEALIQIQGPIGTRTIPIAELHRLPDDSPHLDTSLGQDEVITAVDLPANRFAEHSTYLKVRDRHSYAFALVSVAAALEMDGPRIIKARIALGGVAHKPWRQPEAEDLLEGVMAGEEPFRQVAVALTAGAQGYEHNAFKVELARRAIVRALSQASGIGRS